MSNEAGHLFSFGPFRLDSRKRVLLRDGQPVTLTPKAVDTLLVLVENAGQLVEKAELMQRVWPDAFVEEGNLSKNIHALRKVLGRGVGRREYVETVPTRGYRFVAEVRELPAPGQWVAANGALLPEWEIKVGLPVELKATEPARFLRSSPAQDVLPERPEPVRCEVVELPPHTRDGNQAEVERPESVRGSKPAVQAPQTAARTRARWPLVLAASALVAAAGIAWFLKPRPKAQIQLTERKITANPPEDYVWDAAISPDGAHVAYIDQTGIFVRSVGSGETRAVSIPKALRGRLVKLRWLPGGGRLLVTALSSRVADLWVITVLGEAAPLDAR